MKESSSSLVCKVFFLKVIISLGTNFICERLYVCENGGEKSLCGSFQVFFLTFIIFVFVESIYCCSVVCKVAPRVEFICVSRVSSLLMFHLILRIQGLSD